jgi:hypothetical protein
LKIINDIFSSGHGQVTEIGFTLLLNNLKKQAKIYETMVFRNETKGSDLQDEGDKQEELLAPALLPREFLDQNSRAKNPKWKSMDASLSEGERVKSLGR